MGIAALVLGFTVFSLVSSPVFSGTWRPDNSATSLKQLRLRAISDLEKIPATNRQVQQTIREAVEDITRSLSRQGKEHFLTGAQILSAPHGRRVFQNSKRAVRRLLKGAQVSEAGDSARNVYKRVIDMLLRADASIAERCVLTAERLVELELGRKKTAQSAREQYEQALRETDAVKAADGFRKAWNSAQGVVRFRSLLTTAFRDGPDPFSPRLGPNTLSLTFEILEQGRFSLEFVQIIQEPRSGATIRTLINSPWDGRNNEGKLVRDGKYSYIAYGQLLSPRSAKDKNKKRDKKAEEKRLRIRPSSFPVYGTILVDKTPPTIAQTVTPLPNELGWHKDEVSVSFKASDRLSGLVSTSPPVVVNSEGTEQTVTGMATDRAGNRADLEVSFKLDLHPPILRILGPNSGVTLNASSVTITGSAVDPLSGLDAVMCNGTVGKMTSVIFTCEVPLERGATEIQIQATDRAGNATASTITVHRVSE